MAEVVLEPAGVEKREVLGNLFQLYIHDFSEHWAGTERGELSEAGLFDPYPHLDSYWTDAGREPFLVRAGGGLAGFILINRHSHSGLALDHAIAEFFVVRKHRRGGVGRAAALAAIRPRAGQWELAVARKNVGALAFWRTVAAEVAEGSVDEIDTTDRWNGIILRFRIAPA